MTRVALLLAASLLLVQEPARRRDPPRRPNLELDGQGPLGATRHEFYFTRAAYNSGGWRGWAWTTDYPKADRQFLMGVTRILQFLDSSPDEHPLRLDDPELMRFPFLYAVEVGYMSLSEPEVAGLRRYLQKGGFLIVDDFWGTAEWANFEQEIRSVLPEYPIVELPLEHPLFHTFYDIKQILQVPNVGQGIRGGRTWERDGYEPHCRGIFDEKGRLMVVINWNTDLGDAWEWAENPLYPLQYSTYAYEMGINFIVYAMSR